MEGDKHYSQTGRVFIERTLPNNAGTYYEFGRDSSKNISDIACCAALAFHKALIGIAELSLVEKAGNAFRFAKGVQTYYPVYHLFVCNMLLDDEYKIRYFRDPKSYEVDSDELTSALETPEQWNKGRDLEQDLASLIQHRDIRWYCEKVLRKRAQAQRISPYISVLYRQFVEIDRKNQRTCIHGLYEKLDYIRDRAIYRPTHVIFPNENAAQTSYDVRREIDGLPSSREIYHAALEYYKALYNAVRSELIGQFLFSLTNDIVDCSDKSAKRLGYSWETLEKMRGSKSFNSVPTFICQMMELFDQEETEQFYHEYWEPILNYRGE